MNISTRKNFRNGRSTRSTTICGKILKRPIELPFEPRLAFAFKDRSFVGNLEQCNGCGGCRKMRRRCAQHFSRLAKKSCPRVAAQHHPNAFEWRERRPRSARSEELDAALSNCLSCKGCTPECPSNVNLALLKAELLYARHRRDGLPMRERILSNVDLLGRLGCAMPALANLSLELRPLRLLLEKTLGLSAKRSLPHYVPERFDKWFRRRTVVAVDDRRNQTDPALIERRYRRGQVILWDDTFVRYNEPHIGIAAVKVLEAAGFEVSLAARRKCCGRPAFSQGNLDAAAKVGTQCPSSFITPLLQYSNLIPRAIVLFHVRRRLSGVERTERRQTGETLFSFRKVHRRFAGQRTRRAFI